MTDLAPSRDELELVELDRDHPGFRDAAYRARRDEIAALSASYSAGAPIPLVDYTAAEHSLWSLIRERLDPLHDEFVSSELNGLRRRLALPVHQVPQLAELGPRLASFAGCRIEPIPGLVDARTFLAHLGRRVLLSTQYLRHPAQPFYTPEPDAVHELVGHVASLAHPGVAQLNECLGLAASRADQQEMLRLERVYWFVLEFGLLLEDGELRAFGAGLLSSCSELEQIRSGPELLDWDLDRIARTPYDPTRQQQRLFVAPSFDALIRELLAWLREGRWRS